MATNTLAGALAAWSPPHVSPAVSHVVRTVSAAILALYVAYQLQLESAASAATTVLIVAALTRGAILSKSVWRMVGTVAGVLMAVLLMAWFAQAPLLFILAFSLWLGACTFAATLLRHFRAYAAVLAGYTVTLIAFGPALEHPDRILEAALARGAAVTVGVVTAAVVNLLFQPTRHPSALVGRVTELEAQIAALLARVLRGDGVLGGDGLVEERRRLAFAVDAVDEAVEFGAAESFEISQRAAALRTGMAWLSAALTGGCAAMNLARDLAASPDPQLREIGAASVATLSRALAGDAGATLRQRTARAAGELEALMQQTGDVAALAVLAAGAALVEELAEAAANLEDPAARGLRLRRWRNWRSAFRNGARAAIAVTLAGLFWLESAWPAGGTMLVMLGPLCSLLGTNDSAAAASVAFLKGTTIAVVAGFVCVFGVLNSISGFPLLAVTLAVFLAPAIYATTRPRYAGIATAYLIFFTAIISPTNPMHYDVAAFLNIASAFLVGGAVGVLAFRILLPPSAPRDVRLAARSIRASVQRLARHPDVPNQLVWENARHQTLLRLSTRLPAGVHARSRVLEGAIALVLIGRLILRARAALRRQPVPAPARDIADRAIRAIRQPAAMRASRIAEQAAGLLCQAGLPRIAASFHGIQLLLDGHADFIDQEAA